MFVGAFSGGVVQQLTPTELAGLAITAADFDAAVKKVQPSVRREGFATTPDVTWNDVGALTDVCPLSSLNSPCMLLNISPMLQQQTERGPLLEGLCMPLSCRFPSANCLRNG